ncbi:MAG: bifunctional glutamate N-acetyltransferase/amino-acid acetyltransferase ArgJ [Deltaproteobacteria bacterium]|nr:MAG: bifunctional glutamate N-acetyltransferase/amino-acid acetyltransferase ArgJ [Deltaproteobacteria bacterium]
MASNIVQGFKASALAAGIKKDGGLDMALIVSEKGAAAAGVFTTNRVKAAPVILSQENIRKGRVRAIIANSGNANACTGRLGLDNALREAELVAKELGINPDEVLVASTGVIGRPLPMERIERFIPDLAKRLVPEGLPDVAEAIMTTDSFSKISRFEGEAGGKPYQILGIAKGAGMIMPNMATMLCFVLSDIRIDPADLSKSVSSSVKTTFNRISVDGDTSTNDTVLVVANGMAGNGELNSDDFERFQIGLTHVMDTLATMIVRDGEGATKVVYVKIRGAARHADAETAARTIANSYLVKTAFYGQDPNWGRIMAALGRSNISMQEEDVHIWVDEIQIVQGGLAIGADVEKQASKRMAQKEFSVTIDLRQGKHEVQVVTCDLTPEYIAINSDYRT